MQELAKIRLRTLGWLILPLTVLVVIPMFLQRATHQTFAWRGAWWQWPHHLSASRRPAEGREQDRLTEQPSAGLLEADRPTTSTGGNDRKRGGTRQVVGWLGVWLIANGLGLAAWCVNLFNVEGRGTPLPLDPPKRFVVRGPYRYVRNPMMLGALLILGGESVVCGSWSLVLYMVLIMVLAHLFVRFWEEPDLGRRFGQAYLEYRRQVPRWVPRVPWRSRKSA